ncbi:ABC transporter permease [Streptomyces sp. NPDC046197]|uniref:ABC transporter permease n=1 Tax=Streptomyces sp. NPDC046197 TaxID=3154337 RepID=UPI0033FC4CE2
MTSQPSSDTGTRQEPQTDFRRAVGLVIAREVKARAATRSYLLGLFFTAFAVVALMVTFGGGGSSTYELAVTGAPASAVGPAPEGVEARYVPDAATAREQTRDKKVAAALVLENGRAQVLVRGNTPGAARDAAVTMARQWATNRALRDQHVDPGRLAAEVTAAGPHTVTVSGDEKASKSLGAALTVSVLLFVQILGFGMLVSQGVVEEKSTRVVEVLLSVLTPLRLMVGKVVGIGITAFLQMAVLAAAAVGTAEATGTSSVGFPGIGAVVSSVVWFLFGFFFFAFLYAAAGSLVSRPEELQSVVMPVMLITMLPAGVAFVAAQDLSVPWVGVVRYIPPFSCLLMPMLAAVHEAGLAEQAAAAALMTVATGAAAWLTARVYQRSLLHLGATLSWRQALAS